MEYEYIKPTSQFLPIPEKILNQFHISSIEVNNDTHIVSKNEQKSYRWL